MPELTCFVSATATDIGKTWLVEQLAMGLRQAGVDVRARKPVQSFEEGDTDTDAARLARATDDDETLVTKPTMCFPRPLAPPIAARILGRPEPTIGELVASMDVPDCEVLLIEGVGGARSPVTSDGDSCDLAGELAADLVIVVSDAGLGAINDVRGALQAHADIDRVVFLNRFDASDVTQAENLEWLRERDHTLVVTSVTDLVTLVRSILDTQRSSEPMEV